MSVKPIRRTGKLNAGTGDTYPGGGNSAPGLAPGQLGQVLEVPTNARALQLSDTSVGTLRRGKYMYVKNVGTAAARGEVAFVSDRDNFEVTHTGGATVEGEVAGVFINAVAQNKYGWIQVEGDTTVLCKASVTDTTTGNGAYVTTTLATVDSLADATADATAGPAKRHLGVFLEAAANGALKRIDLRNTVYARRGSYV